MDLIVIGQQSDTSTFTVAVPGDQQDAFSFKCEQCGHENEVTSRGEKGIDTSITTYLMETLESWNSVCLFSRDADYAPLVAALRRKGKMVYVAVPPEERPTALVRVSQSTVPLDISFVRRDVAIAKYLMPGGVLDKLVSALVCHEDLAFAVDDNEEGSLSIGVIHARGAESRVRELVSPLLAQLDVIPPLISVEQRNART